MADWPLPYQLSPRQREVVRLVAEGFSDKAISRRLGITVRTVKYHVREVRRKGVTVRSVRTVTFSNGKDDPPNCT